MINVDKIINKIRKSLSPNGLYNEYNGGLPLIYSDKFFIFSLSSENKYLIAIPLTSDANLINSLSGFFNNNIYLYIPEKSILDKISNPNLKYIDRRGLIHQNRNNIEIKKTEYTKTTQLVVKYLLFKAKRKTTTRSVAKFLKVSNTSVQRAYDFLVAINAVTRDGFSTSTVSVNYKSKKEFFNAITKYLLLPYRTVLNTYFKANDESKLFISGYFAISKYCDLDLKNNYEFATSKSYFIEIKSGNQVDKNHDKIFYKYEEFIYDPSLFANGNVIDILDAYIIALNRYSHSKEERIKRALKELERKILHYEIQ